MSYAVQPVAYAGAEKEDLLAFLVEFDSEPGRRSRDSWERRLRAWWDENPAFAPPLPRGWILRCENRIVGFLGAIAFSYIQGQREYNALAATTWRVLPEHRSASLNLFFQYFDRRRDCILLDTTPTAEVSELLQRLKFQKSPPGRQLFLPVRAIGIAPLALLFKGLNCLAFPPLRQPRLKIVDLDASFSVKPESFARDSLLTQKITRAYLEWYCRSPGLPAKRFLGTVADSGELTAFVVWQTDRSRGTPFIRIVRHACRENSTRALCDLVEWLSRNPARTGSDGCRFIAWPIVDDRTLPPLTGLASLLHKKQQFDHYFIIPRSMGNLDRECQRAEGDYGC